MNRKIRIGIPRAFLYYRNYILWKTFFEGIGCTLILSPTTNRDILDVGICLSIDESCLPSKIYLGHINSLSGKCDYILVPRICNYGRENRVCIKFNGIYDVVNNLFSDDILDYDIDYLRFKTEFLEFIRMGARLKKNVFKVLYYYFKGKIKEKKYFEQLCSKQEIILKSDKMKILIVSHSYIVYDNYLSGDIIKFFKDNDIDILYSDRLDRKIACEYAEDFSSTLYFLYSKENIGSAFYYKSAVDGIVFLSAFPCASDSLVNELAMRKLSGVPVLNIVVDDSTATSGLMTRLESFVDILNARRNNG